MKPRHGFLSALGAVAFTFALWPAPAQAMQIGATGSGSGEAWALRARIYQPSEFVNGSSSRAYWAAVTFPNQTFFQAGILDASNQFLDLCQTGFSTFVTALSSGNSLFPSLYNNQNCGITGSKTFVLQVVGINAPYTISWQWSMSDAPLGPVLTLPFSNDHFIKANGGSVTEIVKTGPVGNSEALPTVRYSPAIQFITPSSGGAWLDVLTGRFTATSDRTCRYALSVDAANDIRTGISSSIGSPPCHSAGDPLW